MNVKLFKDMPTEQLTKAIAEYMGYTEVVENNMYDMNGVFGTTDWQGIEPELKSVYPVPDFARSLDAMAEVEKTFNEEQHREYFWHLAQIMADGKNFFDQTKIIYATARQRAEAFCHCDMTEI